MKRVFLIFVAFLVFLLPTNANAQDREYGSITLYKEASTFDTPGQSLAGIEFQINRLSGIDMTTVEGQQQLASISVEQVLRGEVPVDAPLIQRTVAEGERGVARFSNLPLGAYLVQENPSRVGDVARSVSAPFFVSLPYHNAEGIHYHVAGKPKTQPITIVKSADTTTLRSGDTFNYILNSSVLAPDTAGAFSRYVIKDTIPEGLTYNNYHKVELHASGFSATLTEGTHYTLDVVEGRALTLRFNTGGLAELARARTEHFDLTVRFTFNVKAADNLRNGTVLINVGYLYPDGYPENMDSAGFFALDDLAAERNIPSNEVILTVDNDRTGVIIPIIPIPLPGGAGSSGGTTTGEQITQPTPSESGTPDKQLAGLSPDQKSGGRGGLASTGASVFAMLSFGILLSIIGFTLLLRGRRD